MDKVGKDITFDVHGEAKNGYLAIPSQPNAPRVIVLHAWWGLNPFFKSLCDRLASEGFVAFAPDLNEGKIAKTVEEAEQIESETSFQQKHAIVDTLVDVLRGRIEMNREPLSLIGFSMGAAWSLLLASEHPEDIQKVVLFYGSDSVDFTKIKADVLGHFSDADQWEPLDDIRAMETDMHNAGVKTEFHVYPGMSHWFFEDNRPEFDRQAADLAWRRTLEFLRR